MEYTTLTFVVPSDWIDGEYDAKIKKLDLGEQGFLRYTLGVKLGRKSAAENPHRRLLDGEQEAILAADQERILAEQRAYPVVQPKNDAGPSAEEVMTERARERIRAFADAQRKKEAQRLDIEGEPTNQPPVFDRETCTHAGWMTRVQPDNTRLCRCGEIVLFEA